MIEYLYYPHGESVNYMSQIVKTSKVSSDEFLNAAYQKLDYKSGLGFRAPSDRPSQTPKDDIKRKFEWLRLATALGADKIFFVEDYPVVLFFKMDIIDEEKIRQLHIKTWNMSRAPFFFVALPGELRVYSAYRKPVQKLDDWTNEDQWLNRVTEITRVAEVLKEFSRSEMESERAFKFVKREERADEWLLRNLRLLRERLEESGLPQEYTLNLIGRSIFIRYLEDREVLVPGYFADITNGKYENYRNILQDRQLTFKFFKKLEHDFDGNMFPFEDAEAKAISVDHLRLLKQFLSGDNLGEQQMLFFWAYKFDVIPTELISSIYEEFYHALEDDKHGTHYTPADLVDFVLGRILTPQRLESGTILDIACGSGIFLVQAFRRIVQYEMSKHRRMLRPSELVKILRERIFGIDLNGSAVRVAAFSLYLALLDFMEPADIRGRQLPRLRYEVDKSSTDANGSNLFTANSFWLTPDEKACISGRLKTDRYAKRALDEGAIQWPQLPFGDRKFDIVVGNPPWGQSKDDKGHLANLWCKLFDLPVGDEELSQCFIWRARSLVSSAGEIGLLVSSGVFFKHSDTSLQFRRELLSQNRIKAVYNFAHLRHVFFQGQKSEADAPFIAIFFAPEDVAEKAFQNRLEYAGAKRSFMIESLQAIILPKSDWHIVQQVHFLQRDSLWKTLLWGGLQDAQLITELETHNPLSSFISDKGQGYKGKYRGGEQYQRSQLGVTVELAIKNFSRKIDPRCFHPIGSGNLGALGKLSLYHGPRLLIKRCVKERGGAEIVATLTNKSFAFRSSIHSIKLDDLSPENRKVILGVIWSSLARYYHFLTCSTWGIWRPEIHLEEHLRLPICLPSNEKDLRTIVDLVDALLKFDDSALPFWGSKGRSRLDLEKELDNQVFDLYNLDEEQRDLVTDFQQTTIDFFYKGPNAVAVRPPSTEQLLQYKSAFLGAWEDRLKPKGKELEVHIYAPEDNPLIAISFDLKQLGTAREDATLVDSNEWDNLLRRLSASGVLTVPQAKRIYLDRTLKLLHGSSMFIAKRNEMRLWTKSQARQDARELLPDIFRVEWQRGVIR